MNRRTRNPSQHDRRSESRGSSRGEVSSNSRRSSADHPRAPGTVRALTDPTASGDRSDPPSESNHSHSQGQDRSPYDSDRARETLATQQRQSRRTTDPESDQSRSQQALQVSNSIVSSAADDVVSTVHQAGSRSHSSATTATNGARTVQPRPAAAATNNSVPFGPAPEATERDSSHSALGQKGSNLAEEVTLSPAQGPHSAGGAHRQLHHAHQDTEIRHDRRTADSRTHLFPEPSVTCSRCGALHIEHDVHYVCGACSSHSRGTFSLCLSCYRNGSGCGYWLGFGHAAWANYSRLSQTQSQVERPHILYGRKYSRPSRGFVSSPSHSTFRQAGTSVRLSQLYSDEDPARRVMNGVFCDICDRNANSWYWHCDVCNDGAWGFCSGCVNKGNCCTHPLIAIAEDVSSGTAHPDGTIKIGQSDDDNNAKDSQPSKAAASQSTPSTSKLPPSVRALFPFPARVLPVSIECDSCRRVIPARQPRMHCQRCSGGDYDICMSCYPGKVGNRQDEWRRCPAGHRMEVVQAVVDQAGCLRRLVVAEVAGGMATETSEDGNKASPTRRTMLTGDLSGTRDETRPGNTNANYIAAGSGTVDKQRSKKWSWRDGDGVVHAKNLLDMTEQTPRDGGSGVDNATTPVVEGSSRMAAVVPPDGGSGLRILALWSYFPSASATDELSFPRGAEIREAVDINGDWFWGRYAGAVGLFPGNFGRIIN